MNESNNDILPPQLSKLRAVRRGAISVFVMLCLFFIVNTAQLSSDIKSYTGNIHFNSDSQNNNNNEMTLNPDGLGIGTATPAANLHVSGNSIISDKLSIGSSSSATSTLHIAGTMGYSVQTVSDNVTLSGNSYVLVNTSAGKITVALPSASSVPGRLYTIKKITASNSLIVYGSIDSGGGYVFSSGNMNRLKVISDGIQWWVIGKSSAELTTLWTPASITTALWLDANDSSTIHDTGGLVDKWDDKSGNGDNVISSGINRPTTSSTTINGLNTIQFISTTIGAGDSFDVPSLSLTSEGCAIAVYEPDVAGSGYGFGYTLWGRASGGGGQHVDIWSGASYPALFRDDRPNIGNIGVPDSGVSMLAWNGDPSTAYDGRLNGSATYSSNTSYTADADITNTISKIGVTHPNYYFNGKLAEMIVLPAYQTDAQIQKIEGYLAHKWGIEANLPAGHTYKSSPP